MNDLQSLLQGTRERVDQNFLMWLQKQDWPTSFKEAAKYAFVGGGKALRPALVYFAFENFNQGTQKTSPEKSDSPENNFSNDCALAVELIHTYSLIHDDLPAMDNDDLRRGKATLHKKYNEATAILVGDAFLNSAFEILSSSQSASDFQKSRGLNILAGASGGSQLIAGQVLDMNQSPQNLDELSLMHKKKTGALFGASFALGTLAASEVCEDSHLTKIFNWGVDYGLLFQIADDILDIEGSTASLGKSAGKDLDQNKKTYVSFLGLGGAKEFGQTLSKKLLDSGQLLFGNSQTTIAELISFTLNRRN